MHLKYLNFPVLYQHQLVVACLLSMRVCLCVHVNSNKTGRCYGKYICIFSPVVWMATTSQNERVEPKRKKVNRINQGFIPSTKYDIYARLLLILHMIKSWFCRWFGDFSKHKPDDIRRTASPEFRIYKNFDLPYNLSNAPNKTFGIIAMGSKRLFTLPFLLGGSCFWWKICIRWKKWHS